MRFHKLFVVFLIVFVVVGGVSVLRTTRTSADSPGGSGGSRQGAFQVWVSSEGSDRDGCDRRSPCKTFAGAMAKVAAGGQINVVDAGEYGPVTITKSVTVNGEGSLASVQARSGANAITINADAGAVVNLRHLSLDGAQSGADGVKVVSARQVNIESCDIHGFAANGIEFAPSASATLAVSNTQVASNAQAGLLARRGAAGTFSSALVITDSLFASNGREGVRVESGVAGSAVRTEASGNGRSGFAVYGGGVGKATLRMKDSGANENAITVPDSSAAGIFASGTDAVIMADGVMTTGNNYGYATAAGGTALCFGRPEETGGGFGNLLGAYSADPGFFGCLASSF